jgi:hypothetical protein
MAKNNFTAQVEDWVRVAQERETAVIQESFKRTIDIAQVPMAKGGRMRVDTGFLRSSGQASLTGLPAGPIRGEKGKTYDPDEGMVTLTIAKLKPGGSIWFGWTAAYARAREAKDAFMRMAVQRWPQTVNEVVAELKKRIR